MRSTLVPWLIVLVIALCAATFSVVLKGVDSFASLQILEGSAEVAKEAGDKHFTASADASYDVERAKDYYELALKKDPSIRGVHDQLARIAFIQGDLKKALAEINIEIADSRNDERNLYYIRGLIYGFSGEYENAENDYAYHFRTHQKSWAAHVDYAWILLKRGKVNEAVAILSHGIELHPENPWLLNISGSALYEAGHTQAALDSFRNAAKFAEIVTEEKWHTAYPGNEPGSAEVGLATLRESIVANIHRVESEMRNSVVQ